MIDTIKEYFDVIYVGLVLFGMGTVSVFAFNNIYLRKSKKLKDKTKRKENE